MKESIANVYNLFIRERKFPELAKALYNVPARTLGEAITQTPEILAGYEQTGWFAPERMNRLKKRLKIINKKLGCLTSKVGETIENLAKGAVEVAHQSVVLGGPCYILNKSATARILTTLAREQGFDLGVYFCIADYDEVQPELTNIRTPLMGHQGNLVSVPVPKGFEHSPVSVLPLPTQEWYENVEESIRAGYRPLLKVLEQHARTVVIERLEQALAILRWAFVNSRTLGEWAERIIGRLLNIEGDLGIPLFVASDPELRELLVRGMAFLLQPDVRKKFLAAHQRATQLIRENGFRAGIGERTEEYVPFFYECREDSCHRARTELKYEEYGNIALLSGKCPSCGKKVELEANKHEPDLHDVAMFLAPRVDTRQFILDFVIPVVHHIGGGGETAYYAQVIPAAREMNIPFPVFIKYPRVYFNTPWGENLAKRLTQKKVPVLHDSELFKAVGKLNRFRKKKRFVEMNQTTVQLEKLIHEKYEKLNEYLKGLSEKISISSGEKRDMLLFEKMEVQRYLSWTYGHIAPGKRTQEATWAWIEWAINTGFPDLFGPYERAYGSELNNGSTLFINFTL